MGLTLGAAAGLVGGFLTAGWVRRQGAAMPAWVSALALAAVLGLLGARWGLVVRLGPVLVLAGCLWTAAIIDAWTFRIPNLVVIAIAAAATAGRLAGVGLGGTVPAALAALTAGAGFWLLSRVSRGGFGLGDAKLACALVWALGWRAGMLALVLTVLAGGVGAALLVLTRRRGLGSPIPYGPFFLFGGILALWLSAPHVP